MRSGGRVHLEVAGGDEPEDGLQRSRLTLSDPGTWMAPATEAGFQDPVALLLPTSLPSPGSTLPADQATCPMGQCWGEKPERPRPHGAVSRQWLPSPSSCRRRGQAVAGGGRALWGAGGVCQGLAHRTPGAHQQPATGSATRTGGSTDSESSADRGRGASARAARALCSPARKGLLENDQRPEGLAEDLETGSWPVRDEGGHGACCPSPAAGGVPGREGRGKSRAAGGGFLPCLPCPVPTLRHPSGRCPYPRHAAPPSVTNCD